MRGVLGLQWPAAGDEHAETMSGQEQARKTETMICAASPGRENRPEAWSRLQGRAPRVSRRRLLFARLTRSVEQCTVVYHADYVPVSAIWRGEGSGEQPVPWTVAQQRWVVQLCRDLVGLVSFARPGPKDGTRRSSLVSGKPFDLLFEKDQLSIGVIVECLAAVEPSLEEPED